MYFKIHVSGKLCTDLGSRVGCGPQWELTDVFWEKLSLKLPSWFKDTTGLYLLKGEDKGDSMPLSEQGIYMYTWHKKCILECDMHIKSWHASTWACILCIVYMHWRLNVNCCKCFLLHLASGGLLGWVRDRSWWYTAHVSPRRQRCVHLNIRALILGWQQINFEGLLR